ncbi:MAG: YdcF family protein [Chloroflexi bacterium]|nr:YdcF family protein [Chloroflexota bacterium]
MNQKTNLSHKKHLLRNLLIAGAVLVLLVVVVHAFRSQILTGVANFLVVNDQLRSADMIFVLNGDYDTRPFYTSDLYHQGLAPVIGIADSEVSPAENLGLIPNETDIAVGVMERLGVPSDKIIELTTDGGVTSTFDEAVLLRQYIESHDIQRVILVTSVFHTRRAKWIFERELEGLPVTLEVAAVPYSRFDETNWWQSEQGLIALNNEYIKLFFYLIKYK